MIHGGKGISLEGRLFWKAFVSRLEQLFGS